MERKRIGNQEMLREASKRPSAEEVSEILNGVLGEVVEPIKRPLQTLEGEQGVLNELKLKKAELQQGGLVTSRAAVCAHFLYASLRADLLMYAVESFNEKAPEHFRFFHDLTFGFSSFLALIQVAANKNNVRFDNTAEEYSNMKAEIAKRAKFLEEDPRRVLLAECTINDFRQPGRFAETNMSLDYAVEGVKLARDVYGKVYEIAAPLFPEN